MRAVRRPAVRDGIEGFAGFHRRRIVPTAVRAQKRVALRIETGEFFRTGEIREVVAPLAVLGLVVDDPVHNFDLAGAEIALEVRGVVLRIPETELDARKNRKLRGFAAPVRHREFPDFQRFAERHEIGGLRLDFVATRTDGSVAHAVAAFVLVEFGARRLPRWRPELVGVVVADIEVAPADIKRRVVVAVAGQAAEARVAVKRVAARSVGDEAEIGFAAEIIDPRQRGVGLGDDVFALLVVKMSVLHKRMIAIEFG